MTDPSSCGKVVGRIARATSRSCTHEEKNQVKVGQICPSKEEPNHVVNEQELQREFPEESLPTSPNPIEGHCSVDADEERAIYRIPPLSNEFGDGCGDFCSSFSRLDVFENPRLLLLCHKFKRKDPAFGYADVPVKQSCLPVGGFCLQVAGERSLTIGAIHQGFVSVGAECVRKGGDITNDTLGFVSEVNPS